jgi:hypothetical protein
MAADEGLVDSRVPQILEALPPGSKVLVHAGTTLDEAPLASLLTRIFLEAGHSTDIDVYRSGPSAYIAEVQEDLESIAPRLSGWFNALTAMLDLTQHTLSVRGRPRTADRLAVRWRGNDFRS